MAGEKGGVILEELESRRIRVGKERGVPPPEEQFAEAFDEEPAVLLSPPFRPRSVMLEHACPPVP
jgi:hypothetical protein